MKKILLFLLILIIAIIIVVGIRYGGGEPYPDLSSTPMLSDDALQEVLSYAEPIGNVAVSASGRVFFTVHPESRQMRTGTGGPNTDVGAHLLGFLCGLAAGMLLTPLRQQLTQPRWQNYAATLAVTLVTFAWVLAFFA